MICKVWHIQEDFSISELDNDQLILERKDQGEIIVFHQDEIDDIIAALKGVRSHYSAKSRHQEEADAMSRWGKERRPVPDVQDFTT